MKFSNLIKAALLLPMAFYTLTGCASTSSPRLQRSAMRKAAGIQNFQTGIPGDKIYFLDTGHSDCMILESEGKWAVIDAGEDSDNPTQKASSRYKGFEQKVLDFLKTHAMQDGKVKLNFIVGTHAHSDHIGGFDTLILDPDVEIKTAYLKEYRPERIRPYEAEAYDNAEVYDQMAKALESRKVTRVSDIPTEPFMLGNFKITLLNGEYETELTNLAENDNSIGVLVEKGDKRAFLAADIIFANGDEEKLAPLIGKVDILKLGHHGKDDSSSRAFLERLAPAITVQTAYPFTLGDRVGNQLLFEMQVPVLSTVAEDGVVAVIGEEISLYTDIQ